MSFDTSTRLDWLGDSASLFPSPMDGWIRGALSGFESLLFDLAGNPDELSRVHTVWLDHKDDLRDLATANAVSRRLELQAWTGTARDTFDANMTAFEEELVVLGENFEAISGLLKNSGEAAIATVNAIVDMLGALLVWAAAEAFIAVSMSLVTAGASVAAWFGSTAAKLGVAAARVAALVAKLEGIIISILAALQAAAAAVTVLRTAGAIALIAVKAAPTVNKAVDNAGRLN